MSLKSQYVGQKMNALTSNVILVYRDENKMFGAGTYNRIDKMLSQKVAVKSGEANNSRVFKLKKMKSATNLLCPTNSLSPASNINDGEQVQKLSQKESSVKSITSINNSRLSKKMKDQGSTHKKYILFDYLKELMRTRIEENAQKIAQIADQTEKKTVEEKVSKSQSISQWREYLQNYFQCQDTIREILVRHERNIYRYSTNSNEKRMILVSEQKRQAKSKTKRWEVWEEEKDGLKKELAKYKAKVSELEKKILKLVQDYRERKQIYIKEIDKLTKIVNASIKEIPELFAQDNKSPKRVDKKESDIAITISPEYRISKLHQETEYNDKIHLYFSNVSSISDWHNPENKETNLVSKLPAFSTIPL